MQAATVGGRDRAVVFGSEGRRRQGSQRHHGGRTPPGKREFHKPSQVRARRAAIVGTGWCAAAVWVGQAVIVLSTDCAVQRKATRCCLRTGPGERSSGMR
jgi:hypothetical protein